MGQIMHYWGYPEMGEGSNTYYDDEIDNVEIDFSQAYYDFNSMAATYSTPASRLLLYHLGISVNMDLGKSLIGNPTMFNAKRGFPPMA